MRLPAFEALVFSQQPASAPWAPVTDYSEDARKAAEGPHAQLIVDTFNPVYAIDVGCGFNYLAKWVNEIIGCTAMFGMDKDNAAADFNEDVTCRLTDGYYDLVVCREVLEHLTILDIRKAVANLCRLSRRYVYGTTRFSSEHDLLRVETSDDLDPTHITLMSRDFLRLLFALEGFRWRGDLADRMDWMKKGRTFAFERSA